MFNFFPYYEANVPAKNLNDRPTRIPSVKTKMKIKFHSLYNMKVGKDNQGKLLLKALSAIEPTIFGKMYSVVREENPDTPELMRLVQEGDPNKREIINFMLCGMIVMYENNKAISVVIVLNNVLNRIFTIPTFRNQGNMRKLLFIITTGMLATGLPFMSPVIPELIDLFKSIGWTQDPDETINKDGTFSLYLNWKKDTENIEADYGRWEQILTGLQNMPEFPSL